VQVAEMICDLIAGCVRLREQQDQILDCFEPPPPWLNDGIDNELLFSLIRLAACNFPRVRRLSNKVAPIIATHCSQ
jgi:hypothetical protein